MSAAPDLTRWNRAGMSRLRYIDGNAATFLEDLRQFLIARFSDPAARALQWPDLAPGTSPDGWHNLQAEILRLRGEKARDRNQRVIAQYQSERRDLAWEIARELARAAHILTGHIDAYANESCLGAATQWESVRRLVEMIDYHPAPPASATTRLVLTAKPGASGVVTAGFAVSYAPPDGAPPVVFETLEDLAIDSTLDGLLPDQATFSQERFVDHSLLLEGEFDVKSGEPLVLLDRRSNVLRAHLIVGSRVSNGTTEVHISPRLSRRLRKGYTDVFLKPADRLAPLRPCSYGATLKRAAHLTEEPKGLAPGEVVWISDGASTLYRIADSVEGRKVVFDSEVGALRLETAQLDHPVELGIVAREQTVTSGDKVTYYLRVVGDWSRLAGCVVARRVVVGGKQQLATYKVTGVQPYAVDSNDPRHGHSVLLVERNTKQNPHSLDDVSILLAPPAAPGRWRPDTYLEKKGVPIPGKPGHTIARLQPELIVTKSKKSAPGDLAVVVSGRQMAWARLASVSVDEDRKESTFTALEGWADRGGTDYFLADTTVYAHFQVTAHVAGWQVNRQPIVGARIPLESVPETLQKGRGILVERIDDPRAAFFTRVLEVQPNAVILAAPPPPGSTRGNIVLSGNVALAGHGETGIEKVLGSGDGSAGNQSFVFGETGVSFVADPKLAAGVRAAIAIRVQGRTWQQVDTLATSSPGDPHFTVRMTEDGRLEIEFGDGVHGRRLPTGLNNVRILFRKGNGLAGNLPPGCLSKPVKPHRLVQAIRQPMPATGGNDMEDADSLRENAPAALLTLGRAVSLADFSALAAAQSSVYQARAFARPQAGRNYRIEVVVVPAGGGPLGSLAETMRDYLLKHSLPGVDITVLPYQDQPFTLSVQLDVNAAEYNPDDVAASVRAELQSAFSLRRRKLGQDLFLSEIYSRVESVTGVQHSVVVIDSDPSKRRIAAGERAVVTLGALTVVCGGSAPVAAAAPAPPSRLVGRRDVSIIDGLGARFSELLRAAGVRTIAELRGLDMRRGAMPIPLVKLWEFKTKADLILGWPGDARKLEAVLDRPAREIAEGSSSDIAALTGQPELYIDDLKAQLRLLQVALDESAFRAITLRELLAETE